MKPLALLLILALPVFAQQADDAGAAAADKAAVVPQPAYSGDGKKLSGLGFAPFVDVTKWRCVPGRVYSDHCAQTLAFRAVDLGNPGRVSRADCVLDELVSPTGRKC
jgi:hypothetical protein